MSFSERRRGVLYFHRQDRECKQIDKTIQKPYILYQNCASTLSRSGASVLSDKKLPCCFSAVFLKDFTHQMRAQSNKTFVHWVIHWGFFVIVELMVCLVVFAGICRAIFWLSSYSSFDIHRPSGCERAMDNRGVSKGGKQAKLTTEPIQI